MALQAHWRPTRADVHVGRVSHPGCFLAVIQAITARNPLRPARYALRRGHEKPLTWLTRRAVLLWVGDGRQHPHRMAGHDCTAVTSCHDRLPVAYKVRLRSTPCTVAVVQSFPVGVVMPSSFRAFAVAA